MFFYLDINFVFFFSLFRRQREEESEAKEEEKHRIKQITTTHFVRKDRMAGLAKAKSSCAAFARTANSLSGVRGEG